MNSCCNAKQILKHDRSMYGAILPFASGIVQQDKASTLV